MSIQPFFLAGGLTPRNIEEVLGTQDCYCIDVSTGVETDGHKEEAKVREPDREDSQISEREE